MNSQTQVRCYCPAFTDCTSKLTMETDNVEFPRNFADLDRCLTRDIYYTLPTNVKGFRDENYLHCRRICAEITKTYKLGTPIPSVQYSQAQLQTWSKVFTRLTNLYPTHACTLFNDLLRPFLESCDVAADKIPDLETVSKYMRRKTGFRLRPVSTYMAPRDFLAALAFRVFCSSQYVRRDGAALFTNEPDIVHEILGHTVLLCDPEFAQFSQEIGLASLGAPDHILDQITWLYFSVVETGLCQEGAGVKAYGALLLSGVNELEHVRTDHAVKLPLVAKSAASIGRSADELTLETYQEVYYVADNIKDAIRTIRDYLSTLEGRLSLRYDRETNTIERIDETT